MPTFRDRIRTDVPHVGIEIEHGPEGVLAIYVRISNLKAHETIEIDDGDVFCDLDREGNLVGVEMINPGTVRFKRILRKIAARFKVQPLKDFLPQAGKYEKVLQS